MENEDKRLINAKIMPPRYHKLPGEEYDPWKSQVIKWIVGNDGLMEYFFGLLRGRGLIIYDKETGKWTGIDYREIPEFSFRGKMDD